MVTHRARKRKTKSENRKAAIASLPRGTTLDLIARFRGELAMDDTRFEAWLRSRYGPLRGRTQIRTERDAQAVLTALKLMVRRQERNSKSENRKAADPAEACPERSRGVTA
jgi:hypothetical protein